MKADAAGEAPECPSAIRYLWRYFLEISLGLAVSGMAAPSLTWEGLRAWCLLRQTALEPWETLALVRMGQVRAGVLNEASEKASKAKP